MTVKRYNWTPSGMKQAPGGTNGSWVQAGDHDNELGDLGSVSQELLARNTQLSAAATKAKADRDEAYLKREQKDREYTELYEQFTRTVTERNALQQSLNRMRQERDTLSSRRVTLEGAAYRKLPPQIQAYYTQCWYLDEAGTKELVTMLKAVSAACADPAIAKAVNEALTRAQEALQGAQA